MESPDGGTLSLELRRTGGTPTEVTISGRLQGSVTHYLDRFFSSPPRSVSIAGANAAPGATLDGTVLSQQRTSLLFGTVTGDVTFTHTSGTTVTCTEITFGLEQDP